MYLLAGCYERGEGVELDAVKAWDLYRQSADKGYGKARDAVERMTLAKAAKPKPAPKMEKKGWWPFWKKK